MKTIISSILLFTIVHNICCAQGDYTLRLKDDLTLKDIFDAGIRPRQIRGMNSNACEFKADSFTLILPNGKPIVIKDGFGEFRVAGEGTITSITFYEDYKTGINEGLDRLLSYLPIFNGPETEQDVRTYIQRVRDAEDHWVAEDFGVGNPQLSEKWQSGIRASPSHNKDKPLRIISAAGRRYNSRNEEPPRRARTLENALVAPKGYEQFSMEPEPLAPPEPNLPRILTPGERAQKLAEQIRKWGLKRIPEQTTTSERAEIPAKITKNSHSLWWLGGVMLLLGSVLTLFFKLRR